MPLEVATIVKGDIDPNSYIYIVAYVLNALMLLIIAVSTTVHAWAIWGRWRPHEDDRWRLDWSVSMLFWALSINEWVKLPYQLEVFDSRRLTRVWLVSAVAVVVFGVLVNQSMLAEAAKRRGKES